MSHLRITATIFTAGWAVAILLGLPGQAAAEDVAEYDGSWVAPHTMVFLDSSVFASAQKDKSGTSLNETIGEHWVEGACTYDADTGKPGEYCDALRFGLTLYRGPDGSGGDCPDLRHTPLEPREDGGGHLTEDDEKWEIDGEKYKVSQLQSKDGKLYCSDTAKRPMADVMYDYRDSRFDELGTNWPADPQLNYHLVKELPQADDGDHDDQVRGSLLAACDLFEGKGGQHLSMPSWIMAAPNTDPQVELFTGMLSAAGGTGKCCYRDLLGDGTLGECDANDDAIDMCDHLYETDATTGGYVHHEQRLRDDIDDGRYNCGRGEEPHETSGMLPDSQSEMKCHLQGDDCDSDDYPTNLWPLFSCIQMRPTDIDPDDLAIHYCSDALDEEFDQETIDEYGHRDYDRYDEECITLDAENGGIEFIDDDKYMFYPTIDDNTKLCELVAEKEGWTQIICPNEGKLCELEDGSACSLGRYECINEEDVCTRYPDNDDCDSAACADEQIHDTGFTQPNAQMVVDSSGSMDKDDGTSKTRWEEARDVSARLAGWSYEGNGCDDDSTNCDKLHLGVHFWWTGQHLAHGAMEDMDGATMTDAFDAHGADGGTRFHLAAELLEAETALEDPDDPSFGIFFTDGVPDQAFTAREAARTLCELRQRDEPVNTYAVGFRDGDPQMTSFIAAAGGTGQCCVNNSGDDCAGLDEDSPCDRYQYELDHGDDIVADFDDWLDSAEPAGWDDEDFADIVTTLDNEWEAFESSKLGNELDMVYDASVFLYRYVSGNDPSLIDCSAASGNLHGSDEAALRYFICKTENTLSPVVRHSYGNQYAEDVSDLYELENVDDDQNRLDNDYTCEGSHLADNENELYEELQKIAEDLHCTYPLTLPDGETSAPEYTDVTRVKLYMPQLDAVVRVPHEDDDQARDAFRDELCDLGVENCDAYADDGWDFATSGRTAVELTNDLCNFTKEETVEKVTTQVCSLCNPEREGEACGWVACDPDLRTVEDGTAYDSDGVFCEKVEHTCPKNPDETCESWAKTGRCGHGEYACDDETGLPYCKQIRSPQPEICNGVDDDCDGGVDELRENLEQWEDEIDRSDDGRGWFCGFVDTCRCPGGQPDSIGGRIDDGDAEFDKMIEHQEINGKCQCGEGLSDEQMTHYEPTAAPDDQPRTGCAASGAGTSGLGGAIAALVLGLLGWRRRRP